MIKIMIELVFKTFNKLNIREVWVIAEIERFVF